MWVLAVILIAAMLIPLAAMNRSVAGMREELQFMQRLLEDPRRKKPTS